MNEQIKQIAERLRGLRDVLELTAEDIAHDNLVLNTFSYNEGKLPVIDVLSAQVTWLQAYTNVVSAYYQYKVALAEYERALSGF